MTRKVHGGHAEPVSIVEVGDGVSVPITATSASPMQVQVTEGQTDAFARMRMSYPATIYDSKQIFHNSEIVSGENNPLFYDNQEVSGSGTTTTYNANRASTTLGVSALTAGKRVRRTRMHFNYFPGKSQLYILTFVVGNTLSGITKRIGSFTDENGIFLQVTNGDIELCIRSNVTGTPVDTTVSQANWNLDMLDGNGASGHTLDLTKSQILFYDYEWLGVGRVRMGFFIDGVPVYAHEFLHTNDLDAVYMSTPNLPISAEIENDGTGLADEFEVICASVISEGGTEKLGQVRSVDPSLWYNTTVQANVVGDTYILAGIRLKSTHLDLTAELNRINALSTTSDDYILSIHMNPTIGAGTITWVDVPESGIQYGIPSTPSPGISLTDAGPVFGTTLVSSKVREIAENPLNAVRIGSAIDGTPDELWVCVTPLGANLDIRGSIVWREWL